MTRWRVVFLRSLVKRGLRGVRLRPMRTKAEAGDRAREAIAAVARTIFAQPDHATAMAQLPRRTP